MTFGGEYRGGGSEAHGKPHESPSVMVTPMVILAILAVVSGLWNVTGHYGLLMGHVTEVHGFFQGLFAMLDSPLFWTSISMAGLGILLAYAIYSAKWLSAERIGSLFKPLYTLFLRKYWVDELYENVLVKKALIGGFFAGLQKIDTYGVDGAVNGVANGALAGGRTIRRAQTGQLQLYGLFIGIGILAIVLGLYFFG